MAAKETGGVVRLTEMEKRVADAMRERAKEDANMESLARAAIRALSTPHADMVHAATYLGLADDIDCALIYRTMIEAATPPPQKHSGTPPTQEQGA